MNCSLLYPNTRGFEGIQPFSIHSKICRRLHESRNPTSWEIVKNDIFQQEIGNNDILINSINIYSPIISIIEGSVRLKEGKTYEDIELYMNVDINTEEIIKNIFSIYKELSRQIENSKLTEDHFDLTLLKKTSKDLADEELRTVIDHYNDLDLTEYPLKSRKMYVVKLNNLTTELEIRNNKV